MKVVGVIPSRYGSTRFVGKPLAMIAGKPMLSWVIAAAQRAKKLSEVWVATDDERIAELARNCGAKVVMTDSNLATGSDRVWAAVCNEKVDVVLNIQGDEPLLEPDLLDALAAPFEKDNSISMATLGRKISIEDLQSINTAKIVLDKNRNAIYFSRFAVPYTREKKYEMQACLKHIGIYAYRHSFLKEFCAQTPTNIEICEGLEQLRALYLGAKIRVIEVDSDSWGVDVPEDIAKVEERMKRRSWHGKK